MITRTTRGTSRRRSGNEFDAIMSPAEQERWLADPGYLDLAGDRVENDTIRTRYEGYLQRLLALPQADAAIPVLRQYVRTGLPAALRGEGTFWACSCLPDKGQRGVYSRINVNWQEVFTVGVWNDRLGFSWHLARSPLDAAFGPQLRGLAHAHPQAAVLGGPYYRPGGDDQENLFIDDPDAAMALMRDPDIIIAIRTMNLRLMRKGRTPFGRYHCYELADVLVRG